MRDRFRRGDRVGNRLHAQGQENDARAARSATYTVDTATHAVAGGDRLAEDQLHETQPIHASAASGGADPDERAADPDERAAASDHAAGATNRPSAEAREATGTSEQDRARGGSGDTAGGRE